MKVTIVHNNIQVTKDIPTKWDEVTFQQFIELESCGNDMVKVLALFTGVEESILRKARIVGLENVLKTLSFVTIPDYNRKVPDTILGYKIPRNLEFETMGQYADIKAVVDKGLQGMELLKQYAYFCAVFATNPYDADEADKKVQEFFNAPCTEVMAVGNFTFLKLIALSQPTIPNSHRLLTLLRSWKLALKLWFSRLVFTVRYFIWKRRHRINDQKF